MSLYGIQDTLMKTHLVQHTQTHGEGVERAQQSQQAVFQRELNRKADEVVIQTSQSEHANVNPDQEREKNQGGGSGKRKKHDNDSDEPEQDNISGQGQHRINIIV